MTTTTGRNRFSERGTARTLIKKTKVKRGAKVTPCKPTVVICVATRRRDKRRDPRW